MAVPRSRLAAQAVRSLAAAQACSGPLRKINVGVSGVAAQCGAHRRLCGEGARHLRQALHRRQHHPVRRRLLAGRLGGAHPGQYLHHRQRRPDRPRHEGETGLGLAPKTPQAYVVSEKRQEFRRPQGKRLSAAGGGPSAASTGGSAARRSPRPGSRSRTPNSSRRAPPGRLPGSSPGRSTPWRCIPRTPSSP